jgi:hypothetical protein
MFIKGKVFGGDTGYTYIGSYQTQGDLVEAHVSVRNFLPDVPSVVGVVGNFELKIEGKIEGDIIMGTGSVPNYQTVGIAVKLTKISNLPT